MENKQPSFYEEVRGNGISRKEFLKFCTTMAAWLGSRNQRCGSDRKSS